MTSLKDIALIAYNSGWGAKNYGCKDGPRALKTWGLTDKLLEHGITSHWEPFLDTSEISDPALSGLDTLPMIKDYCTLLTTQLSDTTKHQQLPITIGGDHSMAIGTWSAITDLYDIQEQFGLIWIDAHLDAHTPNTTPSDTYHGMPVAALLGHGEKSLIDFVKKGPKIKPEHICLIGIRSFEKEEAQLLDILGVRIFTMEQIRKKGLNTIIKQALSIVTKNTKGFGISIDLDAFDPSCAPGVGSPEQHGIEEQETFHALQGLGRHPMLKAIEIAEYNPHLDKDYKTATLISGLLTSLLTTQD